MVIYFSGSTFFSLIYMIVAYLIVWLTAWLLATLFINTTKGSNPFPKIYTYWMIPIGIHTLGLFIFIGLMMRGMEMEEREPLQIFLYYLGFIMLFIINCVILHKLRSAKKKVVF